MSPTTPGRARARAAALTLYAHSFELAILVILGVSAIRTAQRPEVLTVLAPELVTVWVIANGLGIIGTVAGLFGSADVSGEDPNRRAFYRALEKAALALIAATTASYALLIVLRLPLDVAWSSATQLAGIAAASILRAVAVRKAERIELDQLRRLNARDFIRRLLEEEATKHENEWEEDGDG